LRESMQGVDRVLVDGMSDEQVDRRPTAWPPAMSPPQSLRKVHY